MRFKLVLVGVALLTGTGCSEILLGNTTAARYNVIPGRNQSNDLWNCVAKDNTSFEVMDACMAAKGYWTPTTGAAK